MKSNEKSKPRIQNITDKPNLKKLKLTKRKLRIIDEMKNNSFSNLNN